LSTIIGDNNLRQTEPANNIFPNKILDVTGDDGCQWFGLDPLGKVIDADQKELGAKGPIISIPHFTKGQGDRM